jgi:hypothetical protein
VLQLVTRRLIDMQKMLRTTSQGWQGPETNLLAL